MGTGTNTYGDLTDQQLADKLREGDQMAYTEIYNRYHAALYVHVFNKLRLREESRDIVQDLFAQLWNRHPEIDLKGNLSTYLYVSARYKIFDFIAHRDTKSRYIVSIKEFAEQDCYITDHLVREKELKALIEKEIAGLPEKMRQIFELSRKQHLSHKEIAILLGLSEQTVKKQINNSLKVLRVRLGSVTLFACLF